MKKIIVLLLTICTMAVSTAAMAAAKETYTFKGTNCVTDGSPNDITDAKLTDKITVTTSGDMNRKYAAVTDIKHNNEVGTFPATSTFKPSGSYIYLATASVNDNSIITLNMPEIKKGSKVTLTFAKPIVTNNGSTLRNTNDPYAYLKIADRYISINGDNFDTWRTESVVTGEDTNAIEFHCDKWGAVMISKIEISDGDGKPLHNLNITSTQYANLKVNGIKFCADENGNITIPSYPQNEYVTITAEKDGYKTAETATTIADNDANVDIPLECETDAAYYESDFGSRLGEIAIDGEYKFGDGIGAKEVTRISGRLTFGENGRLAVNTDNGTAAEITYKDGIYVGDTYITSKDNMEFTLDFDKENGFAVISQNDLHIRVDNVNTAFDAIKSVTGQNVTLEYIGISYPDKSKITIDGPDNVSSLADSENGVYYAVKPEYYIPETEISYSVSDIDKMKMVKPGGFVINSGVSGKVTISAEYNGAKAYKEVEIVANPKVAEWQHDGKTLSLHTTDYFGVYNIKDEYGNELHVPLKDYKSSDESVIKIDEKGTMTAVGKGKATITANAYTGVDNIISVDYTVDTFYIDGIAENDVTYAEDEFSEDERIIGYKVLYSDGTSEKIEKTKIPAATVKENGTVVTMEYNPDKNFINVNNNVNTGYKIPASNGMLVDVINKKVKAGDKVPASNGTKKVYLCNENGIKEIKDTDITMDGFEIKDKAGAYYAITPVYKFTDIGDVKDDGKTLDGLFANGYYDITFKKAETKRGDIYVNGFMVGNNVDQSDADRKVTDGALYTVEDVKVKNGEINVSMCDGSTMLDYVIVEYSGNGMFFDQRVYVIGDSLACNYYGDFEKEVGGGRTGWGQVLSDYLNIPVTNLANSGQFAAGLYKTAFPSVIENGRIGDILLIECGYNDRNYSNRDEMIACVKDMIKQCQDNYICPILVTPNASQHDYKPSVVWSSYLRDIAADTGCPIIDLSKQSYDFLYSLYGDNSDGVITKNYNLTEVGGDTLHSSYAAAHKWASIVAQGLKDMGMSDIVNSDFSYTFTDTLGNEITAQVK